MLFDVSGVMSHVEHAEALQTAMRQESRERHAVKIVADLRRAVIGYSSSQWAVVSSRLIDNEATLIPVGFLVSGAQWAPVFQHCLSMSRSGRIRFAFSEPSQVTAWLGQELQALRPARQFQPRGAALRPD